MKINRKKNRIKFIAIWQMSIQKLGNEIMREVVMTNH